MSRLEEIKDDLPLTIRKSPYLEELIEYVEELEEERDEWKDTAQSYYMTNQKLREQNKRYKQALEEIHKFIENHWNNPIISKSDICGKIQSLSAKALKGVE